MGKKRHKTKKRSISKENAGRLPETAARTEAEGGGEKAQRTGRSKYRLAVLALVIVAAGAAAFFFFKGGSGREVKRDENFNFLLITLDTTRADRLGCYGYQAAVTPNLDRLAAGGVRFENAYCQVPLTLPSHASILTGLNPVRHGVHNNGNYVLGQEKITLAEILKEKGFATAAFVASFSVDSRFGLDQGFDVYDDEFETGSPFKPVNSERRADKVLDAFSAWFAGLAGKQFFAWVHFFDPHLPYSPPQEYMRDFAGRPYDGEVAYMDKYVGEVIRLLEAKGLLDRTLIVAAGDHGEAFGEKGENGHGIFIYEMAIRVPFIIYHEGNVPAGLNLAGPARLIDIVPTVLDFLKIGVPDGLDGRSLVPVVQGRKEKRREVYLESFYPRENWGWSELVGLIEDGWKYIQAPRPELYDLGSDPQEEKNLMETGAGRAAEMKSRLEEILASAAGTDSEKRTVSPAEQERLRSLGYIQFAGGGTGGSMPDPKDRVGDLQLFQQAGNFESEGDHASSERIYKELVDRYPDVADTHVNLALVQGRQKRFDLAVETLKQGLEAVPGSETLLVRLGHTYLVMDKLAEALEAMQRTLIVNPDNLDALTVSALIYERWARLDDSLSHLERGLAIEPENEFLRAAYARNLGLSGRVDEAIEAFSGLARDYPDAAYYYQNLGIAYGIKKDHARAVENLEKAIALQPNPKAYFNIAIAYREMGRIAEAIKALEAFLSNPGQESAESIREAETELARLKAELRAP